MCFAAGAHYFYLPRSMNRSGFERVGCSPGTMKAKSMVLLKLRFNSNRDNYGYDDVLSTYFRKVKTFFSKRELKA